MASSSTPSTAHLALQLSWLLGPCRAGTCSSSRPCPAKGAASGRRVMRFRMDERVGGGWVGLQTGWHVSLHSAVSAKDLVAGMMVAAPGIQPDHPWAARPPGSAGHRTAHRCHGVLGATLSACMQSSGGFYFHPRFAAGEAEMQGNVLPRPTPRRWGQKERGSRCTGVWLRACPEVAEAGGEGRGGGECPGCGASWELGSGDECKSQAHGGASGLRHPQTSSELLASSPPQPALSLQGRD